MSTSEKLYEARFSTDRWDNRAISPLPFSNNTQLPYVVIHPGWGKRPEMHKDLMFELLDEGFQPIGIDTRYGYCNKRDSNSGLDFFSVGNENNYFNCNENGNRYFYRRPTGLLDICRSLGIASSSFIGHSEGVRVILTSVFANNNPVQFEKLILVNGVGTGTAGNAVDMAKANLHAIKHRNKVDASKIEALRSFKDSAIHFATHPQRTFKESQEIKKYQAWPDIRKAVDIVGGITVMNAIGDHLISTKEAESAAKEHRDVTFIKTEGSHSNVYESDVRNIVLRQLIENRF